jgi:hypothetical protein
MSYIPVKHSLHAFALAAVVAATALDEPVAPTLSPIESKWVSMIGADPFKECGLSELTDDQLTSLDSEVTRLVKRKTPPANLWLSARSKLRSLGYEEVTITWVKVNGKQGIKVDGMFSDHVTTDVPFMLSKFSTPSGTYWGRPAIFGGLDDLLDSSGNEHSFLFANWEDL